MGLPAKVQICRSSAPPPLRFIFRMGLPAKVKMALFEALADCEYRLVRESAAGGRGKGSGTVYYLLMGVVVLSWSAQLSPEDRGCC